ALDLRRVPSHTPHPAVIQGRRRQKQGPTVMWSGLVGRVFDAVEGGPCPRPRTPTGASLVVYPWKSGVAAVAYGNSDTGAILAETVEPDSESMRSLRAHRQGQVVRRRKGFRFSHARRRRR